MSEYSTHQVGEATEFSTTPAKVPYPIVLVAIPGVLLVIMGFAAGFIYGLLAAGFVYGAMYLLMHSKQATLHRKPVTFRVTDTGVQIAGIAIAKDSIHRVIMRNHVLEAAAGVDVEARGVPTTLAGGLTEPAASAIVADVGKVLQLS